MTGRQVAVLIDADNVHLPALPAVLPEIARLGGIQECRFFGNLPPEARPGLAAAIERAGFPPATFAHHVGRHAADFALTIAAVELSNEVWFDTVCLVSSDGHFAHVARHLRGKGLIVHVFGRKTAARSLQQAASRFHAIEALACPMPVAAAAGCRRVAGQWPSHPGSA